MTYFPAEMSEYETRFRMALAKCGPEPAQKACPKCGMLMVVASDYVSGWCHICPVCYKTDADTIWE